MRMTMRDKLKMCEDHIYKGISLSHLSEQYDNYHVASIKYLIKLYKKHGKKPFLERERHIYKRDTKLLAIGQVLAGESLRSVSVELGLIDPAILRDWVKKYKTKGEEGIQDTYPRANYLLKEERFKAVVDKKVEAENERLRAEIEFLKKSQSLVKKLEGATVIERVKIVKELRTKFKFKILLEIANLASSVYYYNVEAMKNKKNKYENLEEEIKRLFVKIHKKRCGYHQIYHNLKKNGWVVGKNKVLEIMRKNGFTKVHKSKWRKYNSYEGNLGIKIPNLINQNFLTSTPYQKAGTDVTEFPIMGISVYLSPVIDFHSREVLSYAVGTDAKVERVMDMLSQMKKKHGKNIKGLMIQSDQGVQYQSSRYIERLKKYGIIQSMNRKGNCLDNAPTENFFGRLKQEIWNDCKNQYDSVNSLINTIREYVNYYNKNRIVMKTKMTPEECRNNYLTNL
jgi:putative transposase